MIGIVGYGGYVPRLRISRQTVAQANAWYAPQFARRKGSRAFANWDEDTITMAVAAARDCLGEALEAGSRSGVAELWLASNTMPFAERLNSGIVSGALDLADNIKSFDVGGTERVALSALNQAFTSLAADQSKKILVLAADCRQTRAASAQELDYGDAASSVLLGSDSVIAEYLGSSQISVDFVDKFRAYDRDINYHWEERWVRDEGVLKLVPPVVADALKQAGVSPDDVDHFIFPTTLKKVGAKLAAACGLKADALADTLNASIGDSGVAHGLLLLSRLLEQAKPGQIIVLAQFGSGAEAVVLKVAENISHFQPKRGVGAWIDRGVEEKNYTRFLSFKGQLNLERGMRGEQDKKTALTTAWRHRRALQSLTAGRCEVTGSVHFPPSRFSYDNPPLEDTQKPYPLADRKAHVLSWSAEYLSWHPSPPHHYGQIDFDGGGRILMDFTDLEVGDVDSGTEVEVVFRIKDVDEQRGFKRYFWKATPIRGTAK